MLIASASFGGAGSDAAGGEGRSKDDDLALLLEGGASTAGGGGGGGGDGSGSGGVRIRTGSVFPSSSTNAKVKAVVAGTQVCMLSIKHAVVFVHARARGYSTYTRAHQHMRTGPVLILISLSHPILIISCTGMCTGMGTGSCAAPARAA